MRIIDADALNKELQERIGSPSDDKLYEVNLCIIDAPTVPAIPVEWLEWRTMNAKYNGIKEAADAFDEAEYDDIEADSEEEAFQIASDAAMDGGSWDWTVEEVE